MSSQPTRVFISYSHDSPAHKERVLALASRLRAEGVDAWLDRYEADPAEGWPRWMQRQVEQADFVICVCTPVYRRRFEGTEEPGKGKGVTWEGLLASQVLYDAGARNHRLVPVRFEDEAAIPEVLRAFTHYKLPDDYEGLYRRLTGQPAVVAPPLGKVRMLPPHGSTAAGPAPAPATLTSNPPGLEPLPPRSEGLPGEPALARLWGVPMLPPHYVQRGDLAEIVATLAGDGQHTIGIAALPTAGVRQPAGKHGLHGMGGIGKTVLAAAAAQSTAVRQRFADGVYWLTVGQEPQLAALQAQLARALGDAGAFVSASEGKQRLTELLAERAVLLVLDDVWEVEHAARLDVVSARGRLLITTRNRQVLAGLGAAEHCLDVLPPEQALALLADWAGHDMSMLPGHAAAVAESCGRLPLALSMIGAMVHAGVLDWADARALLEQAELAGIAQAFPEYPYPDLLRAIEVSVDALETTARERYLDLAVFPEDQPIPESALEVLWSAHGLSPARVRALMGMLVARSLATRDQDGRLHLHDLQRMYLRGRAGNLAVRHGRLVEAYAARCPGSLAVGPREPDVYFFERLPYHLAGAGLHDELQRLLSDLDWLDAKLRTRGTTELLADFELLRPGDEGTTELWLVRGALRLSSHVLAEDPGQLAGQLIGRLGHFEEQGRAVGKGVVRRLLEQARSHAGLPWLCPVRASLMPPGGPLLRTLSGHTGAVHMVAVLPDGQRVISASWDRTLRLWDLATGQDKRVLSGPTGLIRVVAVTPDGRYAVSASWGRTLKVWDLSTGHAERMLSDHESLVCAVAVTPDGRRAISASEDGMLKVWDLRTRQEERTLRGHKGRVQAMAVTPDGRRAISASAWALTVWDLHTGQEERTRPGQRILALTVLPDSERVIVGTFGGTLQIWNLRTGEEERTLPGHKGAVLAVAVTPDGRRAISASRDSTIKVWNLRVGQRERTLSGHKGAVLAVAVTPDGQRVISASEDYTLKVWDLSAAKEVLTPWTQARVPALAVTSNGQQVISGLADGTWRLWEPVMGQEALMLSGYPTNHAAPSPLEHRSGVLSVAALPDGRRMISASMDGALRVWDMSTGQTQLVLLGHQGGVLGVAVLPDGRRAISAAMDGTVKVWDLAAGQEEYTLCRHKGWISTVAVTPDGRRAISAAMDGVLKVWDLGTRQEIHTLLGHVDRVRAVVVTADGQRAISASDDHTLKVWDLKTGQEERTLMGHTNHVRAVAALPDSRRAISGGDDNALKLWDLASGRLVASFVGDGAIVACAVVPHPGLIVASDHFGWIHVLRLVERAGAS